MVEHREEDIVNSAMRRGTAAVMFLTVPMGIAACGGGNKSTKTAVKSGASKASAAGAQSSSSKPSAQSGSSKPSAQSGAGKPSKADVQSGILKMMSRSKYFKESDKEKANQASQCVTDEMYPKLSTHALSSLAMATASKKDLTAGDKKVFNAAADACEKKVGE